MIAILDQDSDTSSFYLAGNRVGCLLLHGFTATPQEMRGLGARLHSAGHTVHGVLLAGHGTSVADLARTSWPDWLASARAGLTRLQRDTDTTVVVGLSMGSLLALALAHDQPEQVSGVASLSTALLIREQRLERHLLLARTAARLLPRRWQVVAKQGRDIADPVARAASAAYDAMPLRSLISFIQLQRHVRELVPAIHQPVLAVHARQDHTCPLENVSFLERHLPSPPRVELLDTSFHVITVDYEREQVADRVTEFVTSVAAERRGRVAFG